MTHAPPSTPLTVGDSVREICAVCNRSGGSCTNCVDGYVYRGVYDEQRSGEMREDLPAGHCGHSPKCTVAGPPDERDPLGCCNCGTRTTEQLKALVDQRPNDTELGAAVRAIVKGVRHG